MPFAVGELVAGRFELRRKLGAGGLAEVWAAHDTVTGAEVALKALHEHLLFDQGLVERFRRELAVTRGLDHPGIVRVFDLHAHEGRPRFVMEVLQGETVAERLRRGPLAAEEAKRIAAEVCRALACAHRAGVVHRDLKPQNIFLADPAPAAPGEAPGPSKVKLLDLGLARAAGLARLTAQSTVMGTPGYIAPELLSGDGADARSDLYALGATLFEMLAGRRAFPYADPYEVLRKQQQPAPSLREAGAQVSRADDALVRRALDPDPERRFVEAGQLERALSGAPLPPPTAVPPAMSAGQHQLIVHRNRDREWKEEESDLEDLILALGGVPPRDERLFARLTARLGGRAGQPRMKAWLERFSTWGQAPLISGCSLETARRLATFCQQRGIAASVQEQRPVKSGTRLRAGAFALVAAGSLSLFQVVGSLASGSGIRLVFAAGLVAMLLWRVARALNAKAPFSSLPEGDPAVLRLLDGIRRRATRLRDQATASPQAARMLTDELLHASHAMVAEATKLAAQAAVLQDPLTPLPGMALASGAQEAETGRDRDRLISQLLEMAAALDDAIAATSIAAREDQVAPALARVREETAFARRVLPDSLALAAGLSRAGRRDAEPPQATASIGLALAAPEAAPAGSTPVAPRAGGRERAP